MGQWVKCLLPKGKDLSLVPNADIDVTWSVDACNSSAGLGESGGSQGLAGQSI